jgi:hypothetical protein
MNWLTSILTGFSKALLVALAPLVAGALADLLKKAVEKAQAFVVKAALNKELPTGLEKHEWVVNEITPLLKETATNYLPPIRDAVINLAVKSAYDIANTKPQ